MYPINLKSGVTENILSSIYNVDPQHKYRQLNRQIYDESKMSFYARYCNNPITNSEVIRYLQTKPKKMGIVKIFQDGDDNDEQFFTDIQLGYLTRQVLRHDHYHGEYDTIRTLLQDNEYDVENIFENWGTPDIDILIDTINDGKVLDYDLLTTYHIYKVRKDCMRVNPFYAKNQVLTLLNQLSIIPTASLFSIYYYYKYLLLNCSIFDIEENMVALEPLPLNPYEPLSLEHATVTEVLYHLKKVIDNPLDANVHYEFKQKLIIEFNRLLSKLINHINLIL